MATPRNQQSSPQKRQGAQTEERKYRAEGDYDKKIVENALHAIRDQYDRTGKKYGLSADEEFAFVWTILTTNLMLLEKACAEPEQLKRALLTQVSTGLSLDPSKAWGYLVVRQYKLIYDIGYRGLIRIAVDEGLILDATPVLVHKNDTFVFNGPSTKPTHKSTDFFGDRGPIIGGYVEANLPGGRVKIELMRESEFQEIAALNEKSDAWKKDFSKGEMRKKTMIKRASKWWYNSAVSEKAPSERLLSAISYLNEEAGEGLDFQHGNTSEIDEPGKPITKDVPVVPPADDEVSDAFKNRAMNIITRCANAGSFATGYDYLDEKFEGREKELAWAKAKLREYEDAANAQADGGEAGEPPKPNQGAGSQTAAAQTA